MNIIGLDLSMTATGIAMAGGTLLTVRTRLKDADVRLTQIEDAVTMCVNGERVDLAVIEGPGRFQGKTGHVVGMVHGVARLVLSRYGVPFAYVTPATLKKYVTGNGGADKLELIAAALEHAGAVIEDHNQSDAAWLRWAGLDRYTCQGPGAKLPAAQRVLLETTDWPKLAVLR